MDSLKPVGGPSGYLYSLYERKKDDFNFIVKENISDTDFSKKNKSAVKILIDKIPFATYLIDYFRYFHFFSKKYSLIKAGKVHHFHSTRDLFYFWYTFGFLIKPKNIILMSHSPQSPSSEIYDKLIQKGVSKFVASISKWCAVRIDNKAFEIADRILFPAPGAEECYQDLEIDFKTKIDYVLTGCLPPEVHSEKSKILNELSINNDKIIVSYVGRRNRIKGFDLFCELASEFESDPRYAFVCAGVGLDAPKLKNLIDIGWTDKPGDILSISDVILAPNRMTYFDLGILQAMSLGCRVITTDNGGNKFFNNKDIDIYLSEKPTVKHLTKELKKIDSKPSGTSIKNISFFRDNSSIDVFVNNYEKYYKQVTT